MYAIMDNRYTAVEVNNILTYEFVTHDGINFIAPFSEGTTEYWNPDMWVNPNDERRLLLVDDAILSLAPKYQLIADITEVTYSRSQAELMGWFKSYP